MKSNYQSAYLANSRQFTIYEVLVSKMTDKSVWIVNRAIFEGDSDIIKAVARKTTDHEYFSTIEAANNFLKPLLEKEIKRIESRLADLKDGIWFHPLREHKMLDKNTILEV